MGRAVVPSISMPTCKAVDRRGGTEHARAPTAPGSETAFAAASVSAAYVYRRSRDAPLETIIAPMLPSSPSEKPSANSASPT